MKTDQHTSLADTIDAIRANHRDRRFMMNVRKKIDNATKAFLRMQLGFRIDMPKAERDDIAARVEETMKDAEAALENVRKGGEWEDFETDDQLFKDNSRLLKTTFLSRNPFDDVEAKSLSEMRKLVRQLPIWTDWAKDVKGIGENTIGAIVGECGDLSKFASEAKLTKRMGLAVIDGVRQGGLLKSAKVEDWVRHGYSGQRRSILFNFSASIIKIGGPYRVLYDAQKIREVRKAEAKGLTVLPAAEIAKRVKGGADPKKFMSDGHVNRRTCRWTEKRFLRHLWREWKTQHEASGGVPVRASETLSQAA
jgi:hypothetical protein